MAGKSISQIIKLEGAEEIQRLLAGVGNLGEKAMAQVTAATADATKKLEAVSSAVAAAERSFAKVAAAGRNFGSAVGNLGDNFNQFDRALSRTVTKATVFTGVVAAAVVGLARFVAGGNKAADDIEEQAQALGLTAQRYQELGFAASESGVKAGTFASAIRKFSQEVQEDSAKSAKSLVSFVDRLDKNFDDMGGRIKRVGNQTGATFGIIAQGAQILQQKLAAVGETRLFGDLQGELRRLALGTAEMRQEFERLTGLKLPAIGGFDKVREDAEGAKNAIQKLGLELKKAGDGQVDVSDALGQLADKFKILPDGVEKTALSMSIFGRAAGPAMIPFLNQGREGIEALLAEARRLGLFLSKDQIESANKAARAYDILARAATTAKNSIAAAFAPLQTAVASGLTQFLAENKKSLDDFATTLSNKVTPYIESFFRLLSGQGDDTEEGARLVEIKNKFDAIGRTVREVAAVIGQAFTVILGVLDKVAAKLNSVFGTELSGAGLGVILIITKLVGGFALLAAGVRLVVGIFTTFWRLGALIVANWGAVISVLRVVAVAIGVLVGWPALIAAGLVVSAALIVKYWDDIKNGGQATWDFLKKLFTTDLVVDWGLLWNKFLAAGQVELEKTKNEIKKLASIDWGLLWTNFLAAGQAELDKTKAEIEKLLSIDWGRLWADFFAAGKVEIAKTIAEIEKIGAAIKRALSFLPSSPVQGGNTAPEIPQPQSVPAPVDLPSLRSASREADALRESIEGVDNAIDELESSIGFDELSRDIASVRDEAVGMATEFSSQSRKVLDTIDQVSARIQGSTVGLGKGGKSFLTEMFGDPAAFTELKQVAVSGLEEVRTKGQDVATGVRGSVEQMRLLAEAMRPVVVENGKIVSGAAQIKDGITAAGLTMQQLIEKHKTVVVEDGKIVSGTEQVKAAWQGVSTQIAEAVKQAQQLAPLTQKAAEPGVFRAPQSTIAPPLAAPTIGTGVGPSAGVQQVKDSFTAATTELQTLASTALQLIQSLANDAAASIGSVLSSLGGQASAAGQAITESLSGVPSVVQSIVNVLGQIGGALPSLSEMFFALGNAITQSLNTSALDTFASASQSMAATVSAALDQVIQKANEAIAALQQLAQAQQGAIAGGVGGTPYAAGGYTGAGGRFTPAGIVHRGEYVQPANVVGRPGVLTFMEMLRRSGGDLRSVIDRFMRGFSAGGLVDGLSRSLDINVVPGFAAGGLVTPTPAAGRNLGTLMLRTESGQSFAVMTDEDTAVALTRVARRSGNNATMRRAPMWDRYGA